MEQNKKYYIGNHTIEIRLSSTGSISPWEQDYYDNHKIEGFMVTSDMCFFLKDNYKIYKFKGSAHIQDITKYLTTLETEVKNLGLEYPQSIVSEELQKRLDDLYNNHFEEIEYMPEDIAMMRIKREIEKLIINHNYTKPNVKIANMLLNLSEDFK